MGEQVDGPGLSGRKKKGKKRGNVEIAFDTIHIFNGKKKGEDLNG